MEINMRPRLIAFAIVLAALLPCSAYAQTSTGTSATSPSATATSPNNATGTMATQPSNQTAQALPQKIKQKLQQQGFSDVQVVPGSFIVSAKDKDGDLVNMVIGPNSMMMMTSSQVSGTPNSSSTTTGQSGSTSSTK
jgi:hypothetical protein